jgi:hypothetical protein
MRNPWLRLPKRAPFVLDVDQPFVDAPDATRGLKARELGSQ